MEIHKGFETQRLVVRPTSIDDAEFIFELMNTPAWIRNIGDRKITSVEKAKNYILTRMLPQLERLGYGNYTIIRKNDDLKIGICGLYERAGLEGIDIGFALLPEHVGVGYAFEAANTLKNAAFNTFGLKVMYAITAKDNTSSHKLLERLGLELSGTKRLPGDDEELLLYKIEKNN